MDRPASMPRGLTIGEAIDWLEERYPEGTVEDDLEWADEMIGFLTEPRDAAPDPPAFPDVPEGFWRVYEMPVEGDAVRLESVGWVTNGDYERWHSGEPILETK